MSTKALQKVIRCAEVGARTALYPISAWELDTLKAEQVVRDRLNESTIYIIGQRPMVWFDNVVTTDQEIVFEITDHALPPLKCRINPLRAKLCGPGEDVAVEFGFHREASSDPQPLKNVAAIRVFDAEQGFKVWWSPQKLLFEHIVNKLPVTIAGDIAPYLRFEVHYIGQAFDQTVWDRLKAHENLQRVLIREPGRGEGHSQPSLEITLFMLEIHKLREYFLDAENLPKVKGPRPVIHKIPVDSDDPARLAFLEDKVELGDEPLTHEIEALLINLYKPLYNRIHFDNYPKIKRGLRALGFSDIEFTLDRFPFKLVTKEGVNPLDGEN